MLERRFKLLETLTIFNKASIIIVHKAQIEANCPSRNHTVTTELTSYIFIKKITTIIHKEYTMLTGTN